MKKFANILLFFIAKITIQHDAYVSGGCVYDDKDPSVVFCDNLDGGNAFPDGVFSNITALTLDNEKSSKQWIITNPDTFTRFFRLQNLSITGPLYLKKNLIERIDELTGKFFNIKTLRSLSLYQCRFVNTRVKMAPPPYLKHVSLRSYSVNVLDWRGVGTLTSLAVSDVEFLNLSDLAYPSAASLTELHTTRVGDVIRIYDVAYLCHLDVFSFDDDSLTGKDVDQHCECKRYKSWRDFLSTEERVTLEYKTNKPLTCSSVELDCSKYTLDEAKQNRTKCLSLSKLSKRRNRISSIWPLLQPIPWFVYTMGRVFVLSAGLTSVVFIAKFMSTYSLPGANEIDEIPASVT